MDDLDLILAATTADQEVPARVADAGALALIASVLLRVEGRAAEQARTSEAA